MSDLREDVKSENEKYWDAISPKIAYFFKNIPQDQKEQFWDIAFERELNRFKIEEFIEYIRACVDVNQNCEVNDIINIFMEQGGEGGLLRESLKRKVLK